MSWNVCIIEPECNISYNAKSDTISDTNDHQLTDEIPFGEWLRKQRRSLDLTRQALAAQAGCAEITLRRIENGTLKPSKELALILLEKLGAPQLERPQWINFARGLSGLPTAPASSFASQPLTNLPASLTTFIGREKERAAIIKHIKKHRLVTLTGPGGVGKTRLSISVGEQVLRDFANGVWLVELAALNDPALLPQTVMALFGLAAQPDMAYTDILVNALRAKTSLLILDNCEHLLEASAWLADTLLKNCPNLKILATSRESLGVAGEAAYRVPPLGLPALEQLLENFRGYESVRLFEERAQLAKTDFSLTIENAASVAQICQWLDGIPLAIELAAAQVNMFSTQQIAARLHDSFNLLTGGSRTALQRQQTVRASIEWSWALLSAAERSLLRRLAVFAGGWRLEAAETVCGAPLAREAGGAGAGPNVLAALTQLVKKSLVVVDADDGQAALEPRYRMLETIRQYAREKLVESGEGENARNRHLQFYLNFAEQADAKLRTAEQLTWRNHLETEHDNCRAAQDWALASGQIEAGIRLGWALTLFWYMRGYWAEGRERTARWLTRLDAADQTLGRALMLGAAGVFTVLLGDRTRAHRLVEDCLAIVPLVVNQNKSTVAGLLPFLGLAVMAGGDDKKAQSISEHALALGRETGDWWVIGAALERLALCAMQLGDYAAARQLFEEGMAAMRTIGDEWGWSLFSTNLGDLLYIQGDYAAARTLLESSLTFIRKMGDNNSLAHTLGSLGRVEQAERNYARAHARLEEAIEISQAAGHRSHYLWSRARLGYILLRQDETRAARAIFSEAAQDFQNDHIELGVIYTLEGLASWGVVAGNPNHAARLVGWADAARIRVGVSRPQIQQTDLDQDNAACRLALGESAFSDAYEAGRGMTLEQAVAYALEEDKK